ncbi:MAG: hypothetical protein AAF619_05175 [Pseudomonadota bacterium]
MSIIENVLAAVLLFVGAVGLWRIIRQSRANEASNSGFAEADPSSILAIGFATVASAVGALWLAYASESGGRPFFYFILVAFGFAVASFYAWRWGRR